MKAVLVSTLVMVATSSLSLPAAPADDWFQPFRTVADYRPKGPTHCFRQFNIDWSWICNRQIGRAHV